MTKRKAKTVNITSLKAKINRLLAIPDVKQDTKAVLATLLEEILMESGNYKGFNYHKWLNGGHQDWVKDGEPEDKTPYYGEEYTRVYF